MNGIIFQIIKNFLGLVHDRLAIEGDEVYTELLHQAALFPPAQLLENVIENKINKKRNGVLT